jgi:hypothetical protein
VILAGPQSARVRLRHTVWRSAACGWSHHIRQSRRYTCRARMYRAGCPPNRVRYSRRRCFRVVDLL